MSNEIEYLFQELSDFIMEEMPFDYLPDLHEYSIESQSLILIFTIEDGIFTILLIEILGKKYSGIGTSVVDIIHEYANLHDFDVRASNVVDTARGFWEKMGYQESELQNSYFRAA